MQLSEAILIGSVGIQAFAGERCNFSTSDKQGCALGMAEFAIGRFGSSCAAEKEWPWLEGEYSGKYYPCGCCKAPSWANYTCVIAQTFNNHVMGKGDWTIEQLADYVRTVEPRELPDLPLSEQHRLEEIDAEREALVSGRDPIHDSNGRW